MIKTKFAIIGGGLSGLYAAYLLEQAGIRDYLLLEARERLGGRVHTQDQIDLGATWIWPRLNPELMHLIETLELPYFEQSNAGDLVFERQRDQSTIRISNTTLDTSAIRLVGGMENLIHSLSNRIAINRIRLGKRVTEIRYQEHQGVELTVMNQSGVEMHLSCEQILLAMPPRLAIDQIKFEPSLPASTMKQWTNTATWMAPHAKYVAIYPEAFWKAQGLSGQARSHAGPLGEVHDASTPDQHAALFGFLSLPYAVRKQMGEKALLAHCRAQLVRLFGSSAAQPQAEYLKDWSGDENTAIEMDWKSPALFHAMAPENTPNQSIWQNRLLGISSEWSKSYAGYLAGAIEAAKFGVDRLLPSTSSAQ